MLLASSRLSLSPIWQLQKMAYGRLGVESWAKGRVPFLMTNNSRFAAQVSDIGCAAFPKGPLTILELGGGCGKFAFLFLSELLERKIPKVRYLLTDAAEKNVAFWKDHPQLKPWIEQGILETAVMDPLSADPPFANFIVANYFFDSIPQDLFRVEKGVLLEGQVSLHADVERVDWDDPNLLAKVRVEVAFRPLEEDPYPEFPEATALLEEYSRRSDDFSFVFPIGALRVIRRIETVAGNDFLFLAADRGPCMAEDLSGMSLLPNLHGSAFSFPVNFHAIGRYMERKGGTAMFSKKHAADFSVALLSRKSSIPKKCFNTQVFGPLNTEALDFSGILKRLEEANWDATLFFSFFDRIQGLFGQAKDFEKKEMLIGMRRIKERFFPMFGEEALLLERLGQFFKSIGEEAEAAVHFQMAAELSLPWQNFDVFAFLETNPPSGDLLQIGGKRKAFKGIRKYEQIAWSGSMEALGKFDTVFLFPPRVISERVKPAFVREIEERFSLDEIRYSDADIEMLFSTLESDTDPNHVLHFFSELERKKNISRDQFDRIAKRLGRESEFQEEDHFFETLEVCLKKHMNPGAVLRAFIPGAQTYDDPRFFEKIVVDPYLETEEIEGPEGVWVTVRK